MPRTELTPQDKEYKKIIARNLNELLELNNKKQIDIKRTTGIPASTLTGYFKGTRLPSPTNVEKLADFFGVLKSDIDPRFKKISESSDDGLQIRLLSKFNQLDKKNKKRVVDYADSQLKAQQYSKINDTPVYYEVTLYGAVSAGTGEWLQDEHKETISVTQKPPLHDFAVRVNGDSMLPLFVDGQIVYVNKIDDDSDIHSNQIVIAELNGNAYLKKLILNSTGCSLVSLNPKYKDIQISESDNFRVAGVVVF